MSEKIVLNTLLVASSRAEADSLEKILQRGDLTLAITKASDVGEAQKQLKNGQYDICILHESLNEAPQLRLLEAVMKAGASIKTAMIPVTVSDSREILMRYIKAGAHGIVIAPARADAIAKVVTTALASKKSLVTSRPTAAPESKEEIASLPWILETVAAKLERVSELLEKKQGGDKVPASAKTVKEALLGSIAGTPEFDDAALVEFVDFLISQQAKK